MPTAPQTTAAQEPEQSAPNTNNGINIGTIIFIVIAAAVRGMRYSTWLTTIFAAGQAPENGVLSAY